MSFPVNETGKSPLRLGTAEQTIKIHRANLMKKLKAESLAELVKLAERMGIMSSPPD